MHLPPLVNLTNAHANSSRLEESNATGSPSEHEQPRPAHSTSVPNPEGGTNARGIAKRAGSSNTSLALQLRSQFRLAGNKLSRSASSSALSTEGVSTAGDIELKRGMSFDDNHTNPLKSQLFNPEFLHLMESKSRKRSNTLQWGTPESPRKKNGRSTIKPHEREGNVETGKPKLNEARFFIDENQEASSELIELIENVRNGGRPIVFGMDIDGRFVGAPEMPVPRVILKDDEGKPVEAVLGHAALVAGEKLRIAGEISMMLYEKEHPLYNPEKPDKKRLVLINKSGRYGREGVRTEEHLLNVENLLAKQGVLVDEVIFRRKKNEEVNDTSLLLREVGQPQQQPSTSN